MSRDLYTMPSIFKTLPEAFDYHHLRHPEKLALMMVNDPFQDERNSALSYDHLRTAALAMAAHLQDYYPKLSRILLPCSVNQEFAISFLACIYAGMIAVPSPLPTEYSHQRERLNNIMKDAGIVAIIASVKDKPLLDEWLVDSTTVCPVLVIDGKVAFFDTGRIELTTDSSAITFPVILPEDVALLQYTSGSTGSPKGVIITHSNLVHNAASFQFTLGYGKDTRFGGWIPLYHDMGLMAQLLPPLMIGSSCYMMTPKQFLKRPFHWLKMIERFRINHSCAPNFAFELCCRRVSELQLHELDLSSLKYLINGSEPIQADTVKAFSTYFKSAGFSESTMQPCYGMAECTVFISGAQPRPPRLLRADRTELQKNRFHPTQQEQAQVLVSCGSAKYLDLIVVGFESRERLADENIGEIWIKGDSVAKGYWQNEKATEEIFKAYTIAEEGPYLRTGDLGFIQDGEIFVTGRNKEIIITHGKNLFPQDIEHGLRVSFPALAGRYGAVFGVSDGQDQESLVICHELPGRVDDEQLEKLLTDIRAWAQREWGAPLAAVVLVRPGAVSRTTSGKIQRNQMRELFLKQQLKVRTQWLSLSTQAYFNSFQESKLAVVL